ncbi:sugar transferase [Anaerovibrio sp.]|uniref:sugar transferase n=1 Tax=Anaerovibrio sp. TaxID=1872532 RepID=UPI00388EAD9B
MNLRREMGFYEKYIKRLIDIGCSLCALICFSWLFVIIGIAVKIKLGSPIIFKQPRPGIVDADTGNEKIFMMYKFRTMTDERDADGNLLPDEVRLTSFGAWLRSTSLDEIPELFNILNGTMSLIGPRPQLVRDMVFMSEGQRMRHTARPGLSGLAQVNGRNAISWDEKLQFDLQYIKDISCIKDLKIILKTISKAFIKREGITEEDMATAEDYGDFLLRVGRIDKNEYDRKQELARNLLEENMN